MAVTICNCRKLEKPRRWRRERRLVNHKFIFYKRNSQLSRSVQYANGSKIVLWPNMEWQRSIPNGNAKNYPSSFALFAEWQRNVQRFITHMFSYLFSHLDWLEKRVDDVIYVFFVSLIYETSRKYSSNFWFIWNIV